MKTIKFRAWDKESNKMFIPKRLFLADDNTFQSGELMINQRWNTHILMQYTGLKDKNGKDIYEGDVLNTKEGQYGKLEVNFHQGVFGVTGADSGHYPLRAFTKTGTSISERRIDVEIIGNIHENPESLTKNK